MPPATSLEMTNTIQVGEKWDVKQTTFIDRVEQQLLDLNLEVSTTGATNETLHANHKGKFKDCGDLTRFCFPFLDANKVSDRDTISRFGIDTNWDEVKSVLMLVKMSIWRVTENVDQVFWNPILRPQNAIDHDLREGFYGTDKQGRPVFYFKPNPSLVGKMMKLPGYTFEEMMTWHIAIGELGRCLQKASKTDRGVAVVDLSHIGVSSVANGEQMKILKGWAKIDEQFCPESLAQIYVINAPFSIRAIWGVLGLILDERLKAKIKFMKKKDELFQYIESSMVPKSVLPGAEGPEDFISSGKYFQHLKDGRGWDLILKENGGWIEEASTSE